MNNITIGQYIPGNSWLHKLDPRIKLVSVILMLVAIFVVPISTTDIVPAISMLGLLGLMAALTMSSGVPLKKVLNGLRPIVFLLTFTFLLQILYVKDGTLLTDPPITMHIGLASIAGIILYIVFYQWSKAYVKFRIIYFVMAVVAVFAIQALLPFGAFFSYEVAVYDQGLIRGAFIFVRITNVIVLTSLLTFTTMTTDLNYGIESLMRPTKKIGVPVDVIAMMLSLTLRYIPTLLGETQKIMKAQASRGVDFKESTFKEKIIQIISLLIPVFVISFKRAEDLSNAMEVRGYVIGLPRTKLDTFSVKKLDLFVLLVALLMTAGIIVLQIVL
ncbi:MAG: energy-coupling factor transporter transmembrane protein EcfT [Acholeplasmataceae bacterium]|nr:energy-coupling factor transporter transmembrane protein EcfT [Acholeplasmataceae bacterium]